MAGEQTKRAPAFVNVRRSGIFKAADIVAPPSITRIGCIGGKIWLEVEHLPADFRIARKAKRIAMAANLRIAGKDQRTPISAAVIEIVVVIQSQSGSRPLILD